MSKRDDDVYSMRDCLQDATEEGERLLSSIDSHENSYRQSLQSMLQRARHTSIDDRIQFNCLWMNESDQAALTAIAKGQNAPVPDQRLVGVAEYLSKTAKPILERISGSTKIQRLFNSNKRREYQTDVQSLSQIYQSDDWRRIRQELADRTLSVESYYLNLADTDVNDRALSIISSTLKATQAPLILTMQQLSKIRRACSTYASIDRNIEECRDSIQTCAEQVRKGEARIVMRKTAVQELDSVSTGKIRTAPLTQAGIDTVDQVLREANDLESLPGIGQVFAQRIIAASTNLYNAAIESSKINLSTDNHDPSMTRLISSLVTYDSLTHITKPDELAQGVDFLRSLLSSIPENATGIIFPQDEASLSFIGTALTATTEWFDTLPSDTNETDPIARFKSNPAKYATILDNLGLLPNKQTSSTGDLDDDLVGKIETTRLDTSELHDISLRGYQSFAAKFALSQHKVIIGDEMGLGKTIEALAVCAHLSATKPGMHHFMVICPASVIENWTREAKTHTVLTVHKAYGSNKLGEMHNWEKQGGICITTYTTLTGLSSKIAPETTIDCLIIDEAHYIKNPYAQRTAHCRKLIGNAQYTMLMTGTPLENNVEEISNLAQYINPDIRAKLGAANTPVEFRKTIAPIYLRRNQEDVLTELPKRIDIDDWLGFTASDSETYLAALDANNFTGMRTAGIANAEKSSKTKKIIEILNQAIENNRKTIIFSYFHVSLRNLQQVLFTNNIKTFGPIIGSVTAEERQRIIDEYSEYPYPAVLLSQIAAGGVGLNIQAASVIIICEPQLKPSTEEQAIARAYRMGQINPVTIHHLLNTNETDRRIHELLDWKQRTFDQYARESELAQSSSQAVDISEPQLAKEIIEKERQRLSQTGQRSSYDIPEEDFPLDPPPAATPSLQGPTDETMQPLDHYPDDYPSLPTVQLNDTTVNPSYVSPAYNAYKQSGKPMDVPEPVTPIVDEYFYRTNIMAAMGMTEEKLNSLSHDYKETAPALIAAQPDNPYDKDAIGVWIGGQLVGHIARDQTFRWKRLLDTNHAMEATATVIYSPYSDEFNITVDIRRNQSYIRLLSQH